MSNPFSGIWSAPLKKLYSNLINAALEQGSLSVPCRLIIFGGRYSTCINCLPNPATGKSSGRYKTGGPIEFAQGICPYCQGVYKKEITEEETVYLVVITDHKEWKKLGFNLQTPEGHVLTISNITTLPAIKKAREVIINTDIEDYIKARYERSGEPNVLGPYLGDEAFIATLWKKVG